MGIDMEFENASSNYLDTVLEIVRNGIRIERPRLGRKSSEPKKNQQLAEQFDMAGRITDPVICCQKEHQRNSGSGKEDIYFFLPNDERTRIFYCECKRLNSRLYMEEYVQGTHTGSGNPSGGIQRFILGIHGEPKRLRDNGIIGYVECSTIELWKYHINQRLSVLYSEDDRFEPKVDFQNEFLSKRRYECEDATGEITMHHFLIDLTGNG
jgi:hypothetical protein